MDASSYGIGAVLLQEGQPISYTLATLTQTQQWYSQIEKEALAVIVGLKKYHHYVYGAAHKVTIQTDHRPLIAIFNKELDALSSRLQRLVLKSMPYSFELVHQPGKELYIAATL